MAILTPDYERMQNGQPQDFTTTQQYRKDFKSQDIASAQALITSDNNYLVMDADKLNDLCDTIDYMQQIWMDDKEEFTSAYKRMCGAILCDQYYSRCWVEIYPYDSSQTYNMGDIVARNNVYYFCIADNTTGVWNDSKWLRIGRDDVGLDFIGGSTTSTSHTVDELWIDTSSSLPTWYQGESNIVGYTYPNIRYLTSGDTPYSGEIYMADWAGGGS